MSAFSLLSFQGLNHTVEVVYCQSSHIAHLVWRFGILGQFNFCRRNQKCVSHCLYSASTVVPYTIFKSFVLKQVWVCWFHQWRTSKPVTTLRAIGKKTSHSPSLLVFWSAVSAPSVMSRGWLYRTTI